MAIHTRHSKQKKPQENKLTTERPGKRPKDTSNEHKKQPNPDRDFFMKRLGSYLINNSRCELKYREEMLKLTVTNDILGRLEVLVDPYIIEKAPEKAIEEVKYTDPLKAVHTMYVKPQKRNTEQRSQEPSFIDLAMDLMEEYVGVAVPYIRKQLSAIHSKSVYSAKIDKNHITLKLNTRSAGTIEAHIRKNSEESFDLTSIKYINLAGKTNTYRP